MAGTALVSALTLPCLISVDKDMCVPRLPSFRLRQQTKDKEVRYLTYADLPDQDLTRYGLIGSPTSVEEMFTPPPVEKQVCIDGTPEEAAAELYRTLAGKKIL